MNQQLKQRLVGATVLVILAVIFLPMILKRPTPTRPEAEVQDINLVPYQEQGHAPEIPPEVIAQYEAEHYEDSIGELPPSVVEELNEQEVNIISNEQPKQVPAQIAEPERPVPKPASNVPNSEQTSHAKNQWLIQLGSFSNKENAERMVKRLKQQSYKAFLENVQNDGKAIYRVRIGPLASKEKAQQIKQKVDQQESLKTLIMKYN